MMQPTPYALTSTPATMTEMAVGLVLHNVAASSRKLRPKNSCNICPINSGRSLERAFASFRSVYSAEADGALALQVLIQGLPGHLQFFEFHTVLFRDDAGGQPALNFGADFLLQPADLGGNIGLRDSQNFGHLPLTLVFQVQQQKRPIERRLPLYKFLQALQAILHDAVVRHGRSVMQCLVERY